METKSFKQLLISLRTLNSSQFRRLSNDINVIRIEKIVPVELETKIENLLCPYCQSGSFVRWGKRNDLQRYHCKDCHKKFNSLTKTPLARLRKKGLWLMYSECLKEGLSVRKTANICNVHKNTAFRWRHRFLENIKSIKADHLHGIVEADETYFLRSEKGNKNLTRKPRKRGGKASKRGLSKEQVCVFVSRDRNKNTFDRIFDSFTAKNLANEFLNIIDKDALLCSDSKSVFKKFVKENKIIHGVLNSSKGERVKKGIVHIQNVNSYHSKLKNWMTRFNGVATKNLENYLSWYRQLDEFKEELTPLTILIRAKFGGEYKKQPLTVT
jgi:transposase-like protein